MATRPARVEFHCDKETVKFTHPIPTTLFNTTNPDPNIFISTIKPILTEHYPLCLSSSNPTCCICSSPTTQAILTPMSWLHIPSDPFIHVIAAPACAKAACDTKVRQNMQVMMQQLSSGGAPASESGSGRGKEGVIGEIKPCRVCKKVENTFRCTRCKIAFYCGKEHQKVDWPVHKAACKAASKGE